MTKTTNKTIRQALLERKDEIFNFINFGENEKAKEAIISTIEEFKEEVKDPKQKLKAEEAIEAFKKARGSKLLSLLATYLTAVSISKNINA